MLFIVGMTGSGGSWLGRIFDAHPWVFYRHQPDSVLDTEAIPAFCPPSAMDAQLPAALGHFQQAFEGPLPVSAGSFPVSRKAYRSSSEHRRMQALAAAARGCEKLGLFPRFVRDLRLPDMADFDDERIHLVIESVAALGQMNLFRRLFPDVQIVMMLRHPAGQAHSAIEAAGGRQSATENWGIYADLAATVQARREGLTLDVFKSLDPVERLAWRWAISNDKALEDLAGHFNVRVILYEDLCMDPVAVSQSLFDFAGLDWHPAIDRFVRLSAATGGVRDGGRFKDASRQTASHWREKLDRRQIGLVNDVMRRSRAGAYYLQPAHVGVLAAE
jgi:hypothetical protein